MPTRRSIVTISLILSLMIVFASHSVLAASIDVYLTSKTSTLDCPTTIQFGDIFLCSLAVPSEIDQFTFTAEAGDQIFVRMASRTSGLKPQIRLLNAISTQVCHAESYGSVVDIDVCTITTSGIYTLLCNAFSDGAVGNYGISIQRVNNPTLATPLLFGQYHADTLVASGEIDAYSFTAAANDRIFLRLGSTTSGLKPYVRLYDHNGTKICADYSYGSTVELSSCPILMGGTYTLIVTSFSDSATGNYSFAFLRLNNPVNFAPLNFGEPQAATLAGAAEIDTYTFAANQQDTIILRMGSSTNGLKPQLRLYDANGVQVCSTYSYGRTGELGPCLLPSSGMYVALINAFSDTATGSYAVTLQRLNQPSQAVPLFAGVTATGLITMPGAFSTFTITAALGDVLYTRLSSPISGFHPYIRIFGNDGVKVCDSYGYGKIVDIPSCLLPRAGIYTIIASTLDSALTGAYALTFQWINRPEQTQTLYFNKAQSGQLITDATLGTHSFTAQGSNTILLRMSTTITTIDPYLQIFSRDGTRLCSAYSYSSTVEINQCLLPSDGDYTVIATSYTGGSSNYNLTLVCLTGTCGAIQPPEESVYLPLLAQP